ncbi:type A von Willebrand factor domain-containing protein [Heterostelium album PN500]|uniref:Type A von Willebrand factor domain-containing protein n=1 Tax=Heterostelium pallidum (strain ATCC 26659 / Pp 5 / PN500) TaxID=670386 RepID=D3B746_HETP5|nr:type A von Willebrand factor domain-containing protein [Heterostelium album PN500]EFA82589.1 type A von Willebrand factor domain-containing protein [Heterostelium album PN500]|eukprot:XP_020434706.1 type A von Willebrand factor domain-containing protein [Heterostelium album PN500]
MWLIKQFKKDKHKDGHDHDHHHDKEHHDSEGSAHPEKGETGQQTQPNPVPPPAKSMLEACKVLKLGDEVVMNAVYYDFYRDIDKHLASAHTPITGLLPQLQSSNQFILQDFTIHAKINDTCSISVYRQKYTNSYESPVEATYQLSLPSYATVSAFTILKGIIKDKETAKAEYNDAIASGGQAFMAEKSDSGSFNLQLGNIPPKKEVTVEVTIISEICTSLENLHYFIHKSMFPANSRYNFKFTAEVHLSTPIVEIGMDRLAVNEFITDGPSYAKLVYQVVDPPVPTINRIGNILVAITPQKSEKPQYFVEYNQEDEGYAVGINFYPKFELEPEFLNQKAEFIFVLDCSGSMSGRRIQKAKAVLQLIMRSLNENIKFNIVRFGSSFVKVYPRSTVYNDETLSSVSTQIQFFDADLGGTELFPAIRDILSTEADPAYPRQVFVLTDGEIYDRKQLISYVAKESSSTRIFTVGIGGQVDRELVIGLSNSCKGFYDFIAENDTDYEGKIMKLLEISFQPMISNIKVDWGQLKTIQSPAAIRPIYAGERMMIYGVLNKQDFKNHKTTVTITGDGPTGETLKYEIPIVLTKDNDATVNLHSMATYMRINDLEREEEKGKNNKELIIRLSKRFGLVSKHTSYIVTNESEEVIEDTMKSVKINDTENDEAVSQVDSFAPPPPPSNSNTTSRLSPRLRQQQPQQQQVLTKQSAPSPKISQISPCAPPPPPGGAPPPPRPTASLGDTCFSSAPPPPPPQMGQCGPPPPPAPPSHGPSPFHYGKAAPSSYSRSMPYPGSYPGSYGVVEKATPGPFNQLLALQKANGTWDDKIKPLIEFEDTLKPKIKVIDNIWFTLLVVAFFQTHYQPISSQWKLSIAKAIKYINQQLAQSKEQTSYQDLMTTAKASLKHIELKF